MATQVHLLLAQLNEMIHLYPKVQDVLRDATVPDKMKITDKTYIRLKECIIVTRFLMDRGSGDVSNEELIKEDLSLEKLKDFESPSPEGNNGLKALFSKAVRFVTLDRSEPSVPETLLYAEAKRILKATGDAEFLASLNDLLLKESHFQPLASQVIDLAYSLWDSWIVKTSITLGARVHGIQENALKDRISKQLKTRRDDQISEACLTLMKSVNEHAQSGNEYVLVYLHHG